MAEVTIAEQIESVEWEIADRKSFCSHSDDWKRMEAVLATLKDVEKKERAYVRNLAD